MGRFVLAGLGVAALSGCGASSTVTTAPSPAKCGLTLSMAPSSIGPEGGTGSVTIATQAECTWTATSTASWISGLNPTSGQGGGHVDFQVTANPTSQGRQADIQLNTSTIQIRQDAAACQFDLTPRSQALPAAGGNVSITVTTLAGCAWTATTSDTWLVIAAPAAGNGNGSVNLTAAPNGGASTRTAAIAIGSQSFAVTQAANQPAPAAPVCSSSIVPTGATIAAAGDFVPVTVHATAGCAWTALSHDDWLTVLSGASSTGDGSVTIRVDANTGVARIGSVTIAGQTLTITQADGTKPPCSYTLQSTAQAATAASGLAGTSVIAQPGCGWTATSNASWLTIASGATGSGNGPVTINVAANSGASRSGTVTIAGLAFTVNQAGSCALTIDPASLSLPASATTGNTIGVTTAAGCTWATTSNDTWLTITAGATGGNGNGSVVFSAAANSGASRTGTLTIGGQTFTATQAGSCSFSINPTSASVGTSASTGNSVAITAAGGCGWTATSNDAWLTVTAGATGTGNGTATYSVAANTGVARSGTLSIAGSIFTVNQAGTCALSINPPSQSLAATASTGNTVAVTTAQGCTWSATSNVTWLTITSGATGGNGNGSVVFSAAANSGALRSGTLTIGGQTFTANQAGTCALTINPPSQSLAATASTGNTVAVTTAQGCTWSATSNDTWLTITSGATGGNGNGSVVFSAAANNGAPRTGTLTIGGQTFTANQASGCSFTLNPTGASVVVGATTGNTVAIGAGSGCGWSATSGASWLTITAGSSGTGPGTTTYSVAGNTGAARSGTLTIAGIDFNVNQAGCSFSINPTGASVAATASTGNTVSISTTPTCQWTSTSNATWLTITAGAGGTGGGTTTYSASANTSNARSGTLTVAGVTFTVNQASGCNYTLNPMNASFDKSAQNNRTFSVSTTATCSWTATTTDSWITITTGSGTSNGTVHYDLAANNTGNARTGTIVVSGVPFTINQAK